MQKIITAIAVGLVTYISLGVFSYFPGWWSLTFGLIVGLIGFWATFVAVFLGALAFGVSLVYYSPELFVWYAFIIVILAIFCNKIPSFPRIFILISCAPFLTSVSLFGLHLPLEFCLVMLIPIAVGTVEPAMIAGVACLWCCIVGILGQNELFGNIILGMPIYKFYAAKAVSASFYDFAWVKDTFTSINMQAVFVILGKLIKFMLYQPLIFLQVIGWAIISSIINIFISKKRVLFDVIAAFFATSMIMLLQFIVLSLYPGEKDFNFVKFGITVTVTFAIMIIAWEIFKFFEEKNKLPVELKDYKDGTTDEKDASTFTRPTESLRLENLSLEDTLRMQRQLEEYMKKKFIHEMTAFDIDVVDSAKLKTGESEKEIMFSFKQYWKFVDGVTERYHGNFLNRSGDGAIYIFNNADQAVFAAIEVIRELSKFNQNANTLKSHFNVRIGLNTGKIIAETTKTNNEIFSAVLDISGHLQKLAQPGQILISENTYKVLRNKKDFEISVFSQKDNLQTYAYKKKEPAL